MKNRTSHVMRLLFLVATLAAALPVQEAHGVSTWHRRGDARELAVSYDTGTLELDLDGRRGGSPNASLSVTARIRAYIWTLLDEPIVYCDVAWIVSGGSYDEGPWQDAAQRLDFLDARVSMNFGPGVSVESAAVVICDPGAMARPFVGAPSDFEALSPDEQRRYTSFNVAGSPNWNRFMRSQSPLQQGLHVGRHAASAYNAEHTRVTDRLQRQERSDSAWLSRDSARDVVRAHRREILRRFPGASVRRLFPQPPPSIGTLQVSGAAIRAQRADAQRRRAEEERERFDEELDERRRRQERRVAAGGGDPFFDLPDDIRTPADLRQQAALREEVERATRVRAAAQAEARANAAQHAERRRSIQGSVGTAASRICSTVEQHLTACLAEACGPYPQREIVLWYSEPGQTGNAAQRRHEAQEAARLARERPAWERCAATHRPRCAVQGYPGEDACEGTVNSSLER